MKTLYQLVTQTGYLHFYLAFGDGNLRRFAWRMHAWKLGEPVATLVKLFLLREKVAVERAVEIIGAEVYDRLMDVGILKEEADLVETDGFLLVSFRSVLIFFQQTADPEVYFGGDSIALASYQTPVHGGVTLDLCAGSGIQAMLAALHAGKSYAVEINPKAAKVARMNVEMNSMQDRVEVINSSLQDHGKQTSEMYDLVTFNPPLLPVPPGVGYPFVGDGGSDGLDVTKDILELYLPHLNRNGGIEFIGCAVGHSGDYMFVEELNKVCRKHKAGGYAQIMGKEKLLENNHLYDALVVTISNYNGKPLRECYEICNKHWEELGVDEMYLFFARVGKHDDGREIVPLDISGDKANWFVRSKDY